MASKKPLLSALLWGLGLFVATLGGILFAGLAFLWSARRFSRLNLVNTAALAALVISSAGIAWLLAGNIDLMQRLYFTGAAVLIGLVITMLFARRYVFRPYPLPTKAEDPDPDQRFWHLPTGSRIAYTHYKAAEDHQQPALVYLHGGPATPPRSSYYEMLRRLALEGFDAYLYDQAGSGASLHLADICQYSLERSLADLEAIRRQIGAEQLILMGTSWGAVLAAHYLAAYPERVARVIFLSPGVLGDRKKVRYDFSRTAASDDKRVILPPLRMVVAGLLARSNPALAQAFASQEEMSAVFDGFTSGTSLEYQSNCKGYQPAEDQPTRAGGGNYYANLMILQSLKKAADPRPALQGSPTPALILRGECDYIPWQSTLSYRQALPNSHLVLIPGVGHALTNGQFELVLELIRAFLGDKPLPLEPYQEQAPAQIGVEAAAVQVSV